MSGAPVRGRSSGPGPVVLCGVCGAAHAEENEPRVRASATRGSELDARARPGPRGGPRRGSAAPEGISCSEVDLRRAPVRGASARRGHPGCGPDTPDSEPSARRGATFPEKVAMCAARGRAPQKRGPKGRSSRAASAARRPAETKRPRSGGEPIGAGSQGTMRARMTSARRGASGPEPAKKRAAPRALSTRGARRGTSRRALRPRGRAARARPRTARRTSRPVCRRSTHAAACARPRASCGSSHRGSSARRP